MPAQPVPGRHPGWVVLHVPHDATEIPDEVRPQFLLSDRELEREIRRITDHDTLRLFTAGSGEPRVVRAVRAGVSRLVVDMERFEDDNCEPMAARGLGAVTTRTSQGSPLRHPLTPEERKELLNRYYRPHHAALTRAVDESLEQYGRCLVLDCHSFPSRPLPCDLDRTPVRPDVCIGTDAFHTSQEVRRAFVQAFGAAGFSVRVDAPYAGALVPMKHYRSTPNVLAVMVEVNRRIYMDEDTGDPFPKFKAKAGRVSRCCRDALERFAADL